MGYEGLIGQFSSPGWVPWSARVPGQRGELEGQLYQPVSPKRLALAHLLGGFLGPSCSSHAKFVSPLVCTWDLVACRDLLLENKVNTRRLLSACTPAELTLLGTSGPCKTWSHPNIHSGLPVSFGVAFALRLNKKLGERASLSNDIVESTSLRPAGVPTYANKAGQETLDNQNKASVDGGVCYTISIIFLSIKKGWSSIATRLCGWL
eukprot:967995-Prorocentrum_minimum.AAC.8